MTPQEIVDPIGNPEDDEIVVVFVVHYGNYVTSVSKLELDFASPRFEIRDKAICR